MSDSAIRVENSSKRYSIGRAREWHDTPADFRLRILDEGLQNPRAREGPSAAR
jgi:hypothetical protein